MVVAQRIYVAGPISADTKEEMDANVIIACHITGELIYKGHYPYTPHLLHQLKLKKPHEFWMEFDDQWLRQCDALFYIAPSPGANIELARARELGMRVYFDLEEVPDVKEERR